jgi:hypothetical protein
MPTLAGGNPFLVNDGVDIAEIDAEVRAVPDRKRCIRDLDGEIVVVDGRAYFLWARSTNSS